MEENVKKKRINYDYILILATTVVLFLIAIITVYGMFHFKFNEIAESENPALRIAYYKDMNSLISPFIVALLVLLSICVPKRLFPFKILNIFAGAMIILTIILIAIYDNVTALTVILFISLGLQLVVFILVLLGLKLHFEKEGYWTRVGSSLIHLGFILFVLDFIFLNDLDIHLFIFWSSAIAITLGCIYTFYPPKSKINSLGSVLLILGSFMLLFTLNILGSITGNPYIKNILFQASVISVSLGCVFTFLPHGLSIKKKKIE
jgi:hypothetical protein